MATPTLFIFAGLPAAGKTTLAKYLADNLRLGLSVVADSCNSIELTRREWESVAQAEGAEFVNVEVVCSDSAEHRRRVRNRANSIPDLKLPVWDEVVAPETSYEQLRVLLNEG